MTTRYAIEYAMTAKTATPADLTEALACAILDELVDAPGIIDADLLGDRSLNRVTFTFLVDAADQSAALSIASAAFSAALDAVHEPSAGLVITTDTREAVLSPC